jgi:hypothetical protein
MPPIDPSSRPQAAPTQDAVTVVCLHCGKPQEVGRRAQTVTCKHCYKRLELQDLVFSKYEARRAIETTGIVTVERKAQVIVDRIHCGGLIVRGRVKGEVTSRGPVLVGPEADLIGDVTAPTMAVGAGAVLQGTYRVGKAKPTEVPEIVAAPPPAAVELPTAVEPEGPIDPEA